MKLVIVEGKDDRDFLQKLVSEKLDYALLEGNYTKLKDKALISRMESYVEKYSEFSFVLDSDVNSEDKLREIITKHIPDFPINNTKVFLIENNLEALILSSIENDNKIKEKMKNYFSTLNNDCYVECKEDWKNLSKKKLAVYLSSFKFLRFHPTPNFVQDTNYLQTGVDLNSNAFEPLKNFLTEFAK